MKWNSRDPTFNPTSWLSTRIRRPVTLTTSWIMEREEKTRSVEKSLVVVLGRGRKRVIRTIQTENVWYIFWMTKYMNSTSSKKHWKSLSYNKFWFSRCQKNWESNPKVRIFLVFIKLEWLSSEQWNQINK